MTDPIDPRSPIFIVGMPRSGTTLLSSVLNAHPQIAITPETHFYTRCRSTSPETDTVEQVWGRLRQQPGVQDMDLRTAEIDRIWNRVDQAGASPPDLFRALCSVYAERSGAQVWGEKTPDHLAHVPTLLEEFPHAAVVCIVRDPRDVWLSLRDMPWNRSTLPETAWKWRRYAECTDDYRRAHPNHFRTVNYERLVSNSKRVIQDILGWLGMPFEKEVLAFHEGKTGPADLEREPWKKNIQQPIDSSNKEKWRTQMTPAERWLVQVITGVWLEDWGYSAPAVTVDAAFGRDLVGVLSRSVRTVVGRALRRWRTPRREPADHRPTWLRRKQFTEEGEL